MTDALPLTSSDVDLDPAWSIGTKPHGGYLLGLLAGSALTEEHPHPLSVSAVYPSSPDTGPAHIEVERLRTGRRVATSRVRLAQSGAVRVEALLSTGRLVPGDPLWRTGSAPALPPVEQCPRTPAVRPDGARIGHLEQVEMRPDPATVGYATGTPRGSSEVRAWLRRADGAPTSPLDLVVFADALPPVTFDLGLPGWVPTVELTVLLRGLPAPGWIRAVQSTRLLQDGWIDEDCELWDSEGHLVAQARQLAGYRVPDGVSLVSPPA